MYAFMYAIGRETKPKPNKTWVEGGKWWTVANDKAKELVVSFGVGMVIRVPGEKKPPGCPGGGFLLVDLLRMPP